MHAVLPENTISIAVGGISENSFLSWFKVNVTGFGLGSKLYKPGMLVEEVKLKAQNIVKYYDRYVQG